MTVWMVSCDCLFFIQKHASESSSSFEQRLQVMLHRMGVAKTPPADAKACVSVCVDRTIVNCGVKATHFL